MNKTINFTKKTLEVLTAPKSGMDIYHDKNKKALKLRVMPSGTKTFFLNRRVNGKANRTTIGRFPEITVEQARKLADILNAKIAHGIDPNKEKQDLKNTPSLEELFDHYLEKHAKQHKKSWKNDEKQFIYYLKNDERIRKKRDAQGNPVKIKNKMKWIITTPITKLTLSDMQNLHLDISKNHGKYAANRLIALLSKMFSLAIKWGITSTNPTIGIEKNKEIERERYLEEHEAPKFFAALAEEPNDIAKDYFILCLLTGARRSKVAAMHEKEIRFSKNEWYITNTKTGKSRTIPLMPEAMEIIKRRIERNKKDNNNSGWIFPGNGKTGHYTEPRKALERICKKANIENLRIHDLRRTLGSWQANTGASLPVIGKTLGHTQAKSTQVYAKLSIDPIRDSMRKATKALLDTAENSKK